MLYVRNTCIWRESGTLTLLALSSAELPEKVYLSAWTEARNWYSFRSTEKYKLLANRNKLSLLEFLLNLLNIGPIFNKFCKDSNKPNNFVKTRQFYALPMGEHKFA